MKKLITTIFASLLFLLSMGFSSSSNNNWWEVYFTTPGQENPEIPQTLIKLIDNAKTSIHIAAFEFNLAPVADALVQAKQRGVDVEWITDDEHGLKADKKPNHSQLDKLTKAGIKVTSDHRRGLMHDKFIIFDGQVVWTGSTNLTINGTEKNNNNVLVMKSPEIATIYEGEFQEMQAGKFGITSPSTVAQQKVNVQDTPVQILFGAEDNVAQFLVGEIEKAAKSIEFMAFSFTLDEMGETMAKKAQEGVKVQVIFELRGSQTQYSELPRLFCQGLPVKQDGNPQTFHHKVIILDGETVVTGSFNFSNNADKKNDENVVIIKNPQIAKLYQAELNRRWAEGKEPDKTKIKC